MKAPVEERFDIKNGKAQWKNRSEQGEQSVTGKAFYFPVNAPPEFTGVLARALLKAPDHKLLYCQLAKQRSKSQASSRSGRRNLLSTRIIGLSFTPQTIWLDHNGDTAANVSSWFSVFQAPFERAIPQLQAAQQAADNVWSERLARQIAHVPKSDLLIHNARLFDPRDLTVTPGMSGPYAAIASSVSRQTLT